MVNSIKISNLGIFHLELTDEFGDSIREGFDESSRTQNGSMQLDKRLLIFRIDLARGATSFGESD